MDILEKTFFSIGIDFGHTNIRIGIFQDHKFEIIPNLFLQSQTPSYISFTDDGVLFGEEAKEQSIKDPSNTIYDIQRIIGRKYTDHDFQIEMQK